MEIKTGIGIALWVWLNFGLCFLCFGIDWGNVNMRADTFKERVGVSLLWPFILGHAVLFNRDLLRRPIHDAKCVDSFHNGICDCPTKRGLVVG